MVGRVDQAALYFLRVVGRYHPLRVYGLFPLFLVFFLARAGNETWWHARAGGRNATWARVLGLAYAPVALVKAAIAGPACLNGPALNGSKEAASAESDL